MLERAGVRLDWVSPHVLATTLSWSRIEPEEGTVLIGGGVFAYTFFRQVQVL